MEVLDRRTQPFLPSVVRAFGTDKLIEGRYRASPDEIRTTRDNVSMYFAYILECADKSFYVGCINDLKRRLEQHNNSKWGAHYTKIRRPVRLLYSEQFATLKEARQREAEIKGWRREKKLALMKTRVE